MGGGRGGGRNPTALHGSGGGTDKAGIGRGPRYRRGSRSGGQMAGERSRHGSFEGRVGAQGEAEGS